MNNEKRIPFDWDKYQSGEYEAICRDGSKPEMITYNPNAQEGHKIAAWISGNIKAYYCDGLYLDTREMYFDLFLIPKPKKFQKWINLYSDGNTLEFNFEAIAKDMSLKYETDSSKYVKTILIEWEA